MFPSLSSCTPSTTVSTSFVSTKNQDLLVNLPVTIVGPNLYYVNSSVTTYQIASNLAAGAVSNPNLYLASGTTYKFLFNSTNESFYLTTTGGVAYTSGFRYVYSSSVTRFTHTGDATIRVAIPAAQATFNLPLVITTEPPEKTALWRQSFGSNEKTIMIEGLDYGYTVIQNAVNSHRTSYTFYTLQTDVNIDFVPTLFQIHANYHKNNFIVKVNGLVTPSADYAVFDRGLNGTWIAFKSTYARNTQITVEENGGMYGYALFTPTATTPSVLYYKSRVTPTFTGIIHVSSSGYQNPANKKIALKYGEKVSLSLTTPSSYLGYQFYEYYLDNMQNYFAVVNKNNYNPILKINDRIRKYHNYINYDSSYSLYSIPGQQLVYTSVGGLASGATTGNIDIKNSHVILDVVHSKVNLYTGYGNLLKTIYLPDFPIQWEKYEYTVNGVAYCDLLVLAADGILYRINSSLNLTASQKWTPAVRTTGFLDSNLPINEDIPFKGSFTTYARRNLVASLFPTVIGFVVFSPNIVFMIGSNRIAKVNLTTGAIFNEMVFDALDEFLNIAAFDINGVIVTTVFHRIYYIRDNGLYINLTPSGGPFILGAPCTMPYTSVLPRVVVPDCHNHRLIVISTKNPADVSFINLGDFVPSYARRFGDTVYVTGHDTNRVIQIELTDSNIIQITNGNGVKITNHDLGAKVTVVSVLGDMSMMAHHYMNNRTTLEFRNTGIKKVIPPTLQYREGPSSSIGTNPVTIFLTGEDTVTPIAGPYINWWVNGTIKANLRDAEYLGVNYRASVPGPHRSAIILGEHAIDFDTKTISSELPTDYFAPGSYNSHLIPAVGDGLYYVPPVDALGEYVLPFFINFYGINYNSFLLGSNGILSFNTSYPINTIVPNFNNVGADSLIIEPRNLYVDRPIDNSNVAAVTWGNISPGNKTPGVYYQTTLLGEFQAYKFKFVGTTASPDPNGRVRNTIQIAQSGTVFNLADRALISVNDFVSNPITSPGPPYETIVSTGPLVGNPSCVVTNTFTHLRTDAVAYYTANSNVIYVTTNISAPTKYANIVGAGGKRFAWANNTLVSDYVQGNAILGVNTIVNGITVEGSRPPSNVDTRWIFDVTTNTVTTVYERGNVAPFYSNLVSSASTTTNNKLYSAVSIAPANFSFNSLENRTANTYVQVSKSIYDNLFIGQRLTSNVFVGDETIIDKPIITRTFAMVIQPTSGFEGTGTYPPTTFIVTVNTTNVPDGYSVTVEILPGNLGSPFGSPATITGANSDFEPNFVVKWPNSNIPDLNVPVSTSFSVPIYDNKFEVYLYVKRDLFLEANEDFKVRISGINPNGGDTIFFPDQFNTAPGIIIGRSVNNAPAAPSPRNFSLYYIEFANAYTTTTSSTFGVDATLITFANVLPTSIQAGTVVTTNFGANANVSFDDQIVTTTSTSTIEYRLYQISTVEPFTDSIAGVLTPLTMSGEFVSLSVAQTLPASTPLLFKAPDVHPLVEYQLAFYVGRNFQYIEYNYTGQNEHDNTLTVGLKNADGSQQIKLVGTPTMAYSHLFGSDSGTGLLLNIGAGELSPTPLNAFIPRFPRIFRERIADETEVRYDVYIDFKIPQNSDVRASLDYGYLRVNDGYYTGTETIKENDILSIFVPFLTNRTVSSVILSIGNAQFAIPVAPEKDLKTKSETIYVLANQQTGDNIQYSFTIPATGTYMVPDYFKNATGLGGAELEFERWTGSPLAFAQTLNRGAYYDLFQGDEIIVKNIFTGYRTFDQSEIVFSGVTITRLQIKTVGTPSLVSYLNYEVLDKPYTYQKAIPTLVGYGGNIIFTGDLEKVSNIPQIDLSNPVFFPTIDQTANLVPLYQSRSLTVLDNGVSPTGPYTLYADNIGVTFIKNDQRTESNVVVVSTGDRLGLEWDVQTYHSSNVKIYQITTDALDNSNIYTEVGTWPINNRPISDAVLISGDPASGRSVQTVTVTYGGGGYNRDTVSVEFSAPPQGETARGFALVSESGGVITAIVLVSAGSGYVTPPIVRVLGGNTAIAVASASLVENILSRESTIRVLHQAQQESYNLPIETLPSFGFTTYKYDYISVEQVAYKPITEFGFFTSELVAKFDPYNYNFLTTKQIQTTFISDTLVLVDIGYGLLENSFTTASLENITQWNSFNLLHAALTYGPIVSFTSVSRPLDNHPFIDAQGTSTNSFNSFTSAYAPTFTTWMNQGLYSQIYTDLTASTRGKLDSSATLFVSKNTGFYDSILDAFTPKLIPSWLIETRFQSKEKTTELIGISSFNSYILPYDRNIQFEIFVADNGVSLSGISSFTAQLAETYSSITYFNAEPFGVEVTNFTSIEADIYTTNLLPQIESITSILNVDYGSSNGILFTELGAENVSYAEYYSVLTYETLIVNSLQIPGLDYEALSAGTITENDISFDIAESGGQLAIYLDSEFVESSYLEPEISSLYTFDTIIEMQQFKGVEQYGYNLLEQYLSQEYNYINYLDTSLSPEDLVYNVYEFDIDAKFVQDPMILRDFVAKYVQETMILPELEYEYYSIKYIDISLNFEYYTQDKAFIDILPEYYSLNIQTQDFSEQFIDSGARPIDFKPEIIGSGNRPIEFDAELDEQNNRFLDLKPVLADSGNRLFDLTPIISDPGNRYIDYIPRLDYLPYQFVQLSPYLDYSNLITKDLDPLLVRDERFSHQLSPELDQSTNLYQTMPFLLWQDNEQYNADAFTYGAFKTEFTIYADHGRGGDYGQFQGTPPGTTGRTRGPILTYDQFRGSALLSKSSTYGLGGFVDQASAALVAGKYVSANAFQIIGTSVWNYRIYFANQVFSPKRSTIFPKVWYIRGS